MSRAAATKLYRTFNKGLITEAGYLTYPENASTDELNTVIKPKGSRSRRLGIDYEPSSVASVVAGKSDDDITSEFAWKAASNDPTKNFLAVQIKGVVHFYNMDATPVSGSKKAFTIDLTTYKTSAATNTQVQTTPVQMANGKGFLFIAQQYIEPIVVEYSVSGDTITVTPIVVQIRDFDGVDDNLSPEEQPTTLTKEHYYNLQNQGWVQPGFLGVVEGSGTSNPYTPPAPPSHDTNKGYYDPYDGVYKIYPWYNDF